MEEDTTTADSSFAIDPVLLLPADDDPPNIAKAKKLLKLKKGKLDKLKASGSADDDEEMKRLQKEIDELLALLATQNKKPNTEVSSPSESDNSDDEMTNDSDQDMSDATSKTMRSKTMRRGDENKWMDSDIVEQLAKDADPELFEEYACFTISTFHLDRVGKLGHTRPYLHIYRERSHIWESVCRTESIIWNERSVNPTFETLIVKMAALNHNMPNRAIKIQLCHHDQDGEDIIIGEVKTSWGEILKSLNKPFFISRDAKNKKFHVPPVSNASVNPFISKIPKNHCGLLMFTQASVRFKTSPGVVIAPTTRLFSDDTNCYLKFTVHGRKLPKMDKLGKSDPFIEIYAHMPSDMNDDLVSRTGRNTTTDVLQDDNDVAWKLIYKSDYIEHTLDPHFPTFVRPAKAFCNCDFGMQLRVKCYDWDLNGPPEFIGECITTIRDVMKAHLDEHSNKTDTFTLVNEEEQKINDKYRGSGEIIFRVCDVYTLTSDIDVQADKSLARTKKVYKEGEYKVPKRNAYLAFLSHGQLTKKVESAMKRAGVNSNPGSRGGSRKGTPLANIEEQKPDFPALSAGDGMVDSGDLTNSAAAYAIKQRQNAATSFVLRAEGLPKRGLLQPDCYLEMCAFKNNRWECVAKTDVVKANCNPQFAPLVVKAKDFAPQGKDAPALGEPNALGDPAYPVVINLCIPNKSGPATLIASLTSDILELKQPGAIFDLINPKLAGAEKNCGRLIVERAKLAASSVRKSVKT